MVAGRGSLPFARLHGETLLAHAVRALLEAVPAPVTVVVDQGCRQSAAEVLAEARTPVVILDVAQWWEGRGRETDLLHDPLCPLVPSAFLRDLAVTDGVARVAYRPVTDTVKTTVDGRITGTLDRERLGVVVAPVVIPAGLAAGEPAPSLAFSDLVPWLRARGSVELVRAPPSAQRVADEDSVMLLECVDENARRMR